MKMRWSSVFLAIGCSALASFGLHALEVKPFLVFWWRPVALLMTGAAFLVAEFMVGERNIDAEVWP